MKVHDMAHAGLPGKPYETMASNTIVRLKERVAELEEANRELSNELARQHDIESADAAEWKAQ